MHQFYSLTFSSPVNKKDHLTYQESFIQQIKTKRARRSLSETHHCQVQVQISQPLAVQWEPRVNLSKWYCKHILVDITSFVFRCHNIKMSLWSAGFWLKCEILVLNIFIAGINDTDNDSKQALSVVFAVSFHWVNLAQSWKSWPCHKAEKIHLKPGVCYESVEGARALGWGGWRITE